MSKESARMQARQQIKIQERNNMRRFENIDTNVKDTERRDNTRYVYDLEITTHSFKAYGLTDLEYARVMQAFKILDSHRFVEVEK